MVRRTRQGLIGGLAGVLLLSGCGESSPDAFRRQQAQQQQFLESQRQIDESMRSLEESMRIQQEMDRILRDQQALQDYLQSNPQILEPATAIPAQALPVEAR